mgnify:CR=1 FL=1
MTSLAESTKLVMTTDYAHEASVLQLMKSPYNEAMALLTASAATEAGLQNLMARLSTEKNRWSLGKEALVVDSYGGASSYQFTVSTALTQNAEKPSFADVIVQNREPMTLLLGRHGLHGGTAACCGAAARAYSPPQKVRR